MAYNWTLKEMFERYEKGDAACIADAGKRFPFAAKVLTQLIGNPGARELMAAMPDNFTANKLNGYLKDGKGVDLPDDSDPGESIEEKITRAESKPEKAADKAAPAKKDGRGRPKKEESKATPAKSSGSYDGMSDVDLYKECVSRGIVCEKRKTAKYYIGLLKKDDAAKKKAADAAPENEDADDWGDDGAGDDWGTDSGSDDDDDWTV